jgi:hypothetical protein
MRTEKIKFRVFDQTGFNCVCGNDPAMENQLLLVVGPTMEDASAKLQDVVIKRDLATLESLLHQLRGTLGALGQTYLYDLVKQIQACELEFRGAILLMIYSLLERIKVLANELNYYSKMKQEFSN